MPKLPDRETCCGCSACFAICPVQAIRMVADEEGFLQPVVDRTRCTECGRCEAVCPVLHPNEPRQPLAVYAARVRDDNIRMQSSSGGLFTAFAEEVLRHNGIVFGAGWDITGMRVVHKPAVTSAELAELRGSKYVQSDMGETFVTVKAQLEDGRRVLFTGCPCQVDGLKRYLGHEYAHLLCVEVICNSVPSPMVLEAFCRAESPPITHFIFRDKRLGWHNSLTDGMRKYYHPLWQTGVTVRRSCLNCPSKSFRSVADLTIGDAWGIERYAPEMDDNRGASACFVNTKNGQLQLQGLGDALWKKTIRYEDAIAAQPCVHGRLTLLERNFAQREQFFRKLLLERCNIRRLTRKALHWSLIRMPRGPYWRGAYKMARLILQGGP